MVVLGCTVLPGAVWWRLLESGEVLCTLFWLCQLDPACMDAPAFPVLYSHWVGQGYTFVHSIGLCSSLLGYMKQ